MLCAEFVAGSTPICQITAYVQCCPFVRCRKNPRSHRRLGLSLILSRYKCPKLFFEFINLTTPANPPLLRKYTCYTPDRVKGGKGSHETSLITSETTLRHNPENHKKFPKQIRLNSIRLGVPKFCSAYPKGPATSSQGMRGNISVMATLKFTYFLIQGIMFC